MVFSAAVGGEEKVSPRETALGVDGGYKRVGRNEIFRIS